ncbi:hypothetical protein VSX64_09505 [Aurantimonas sp. C2-6-R+9]|uniref:hypothetical protein n=1 Tax=unclassified Aurantimonas TaxID=2638230 RepID=UPI002E16B768|nr:MULTISPECIES: hypothetical protein [unclassified Aurantimonas]MEC5293004.1 hypothetical protein [Aurantimonas sp. C2-3-R2]MEC5381112.1 hypothetical protein [Aurantimonas sp. C2-6-R+9]MEC5414013.1 hypothetical protein [Aurantimonas sp. C2-4-R8]
MTAGLPADRVADLLATNGYRRIAPPLQVAGLAFEVAGAFVGQGHSHDLVIVGDMAADGERKVVQQVEGIARALDVMRSHRPLTTIIVGPRPVGKTLEALAQVGRLLPVGEANDPAELRDQLAVLLPLVLPATLSADRDLGAGEALTLPDNPLADELVEASKLGEAAVRDHFHAALTAVFAADYDGDPDDDLDDGDSEKGEAQEGCG